MATREEVLSRIRAALSDVPPGRREPQVPRDYHRSRAHPEGDVALFCERVADYEATVQRVPADGVAEAVDAALRRYDATRIGVPAGLPEEWAAFGGEVTVVPDTAGTRCPPPRSTSSTPS